MRYRYWRYEHDGVGVERPGNWLDPLIGTAVHIGIEAALAGMGVEDCVARAREEMLSALREGPIMVYRPGPDPNADFDEGMLLAEALVRGWVAVRLPAILADYDVLFMEREMTKEYTWGPAKVIQLTRPDIVLRRKSDRSIFIMNLKTASRVDQKWRDKWRYDMQTFSEALAVEELLGEPVAGTIMAGLVKGSRMDYPKGSGDYHWDCPLLFAWHRRGEPPMTEDTWEARFEYACTAPHTMGNGRKCPGNRNHRLSGVHRASVAGRLGGISGWISYLAVNDLPFLESQFVELTPILRSAYDIERWKRQKLPSEVRIRENRDYLLTLAEDDPSQEDLLDQWFPMSTADGNCLWPSECTFFQVCHGTARDDLAGHGFAPRTANHPGEFEKED
jgi:hypothetical protein